MKLTKTYSKTYEIEFWPNSDIVKTWGEFREVRERNKQNTRQFSKCFICGHSFAEDEKVVIASVKTKGNLFVCENCFKEHN